MTRNSNEIIDSGWKNKKNKTKLSNSTSRNKNPVVEINKM